MAGSFLAQIQRARAATETARPAEKNISEMTQEELDVALVDSKRRVVEANRAVAAAAAEYTRTPTLAAKLAELQRGRRNHWR